MPSDLTVMTPNDNEIAVSRVFSAPREKVFAAWTRPGLLGRWLTGPEGWVLAVCEMDLRPGGTYRWVWRGPEEAEMGVGGIFKEIVPPERIVATEVWDQDWTGGGEDLVTTTFTEADGRTTVSTTIRYSTKAARDVALTSDMDTGMAVSYGRLDRILATL